MRTASFNDRSIKSVPKYLFQSTAEIHCNNLSVEYQRVQTWWCVVNVNQKTFFLLNPVTTHGICVSMWIGLEEELDTVLIKQFAADKPLIHL